jgi:hypothetical protein
MGLVFKLVKQIPVTSSVSASYALTASYAENGGVTRLIAGSNIGLSPGSGTGAVTINSIPEGGNPGGLTTQIQYNSGSTFDGVPTLTYNGTTLVGTGSFSGSFRGNLTGTASFSSTSSYIDGGTF